MARKKKGARKGGKWLQGARAEFKRKGTLGSYGSHSDAQKRRDIAKGGKIGRKAQFALNAEKSHRKKSGRKAKRG